MVNAIKNGFEIIIKMCVTQLGMTMFGLMLAMATRSNNTLLLVASIFSIIFYLFLLYIHIWEHGAKDRIKIDGDRLEYNRFTGLYLSLVANSLNILLAIGRTIGYYCCNFETNSPIWAGDLFGITNSIARFIQGMYTGILMQFSPSDNPALTHPIFFFLIIIPALFISFIGYWLGCNNIKIVNILTGKKSKK